MLLSQERQLCNMMGMGNLLDHSHSFTRYLYAMPHVIYLNIQIDIFCLLKSIDFIQTVLHAYFLLSESFLLSEKLCIGDRDDIQSLLKNIRDVL